MLLLRLLQPQLLGGRRSQYARVPVAVIGSCKLSAPRQGARLIPGCDATGFVGWQPRTLAAIVNDLLPMCDAQ